MPSKSGVAGGLGQLGHEARVRLLVAGEPPVKPADISYVEWVIGDDDSARFFAGNASKVEWLEWIVQRKPFPSLFERGRSLSLAEFALSAWFHDMVLSYPDEALLVTQIHGGHLNDTVGAGLAMRLAGHLPETKALGRWLRVLMQSDDQNVADRADRSSPSDALAEDRVVALALLAHLTRPRVELRPTFSFGGDEARESTEFSIEFLIGDDRQLPECWATVFQPHLDDWAEELAAVLENQLSSIHRTLRLVGQASARWDSYSFIRATIEGPAGSPLKRGRLPDRRTA